MKIKSQSDPGFIRINSLFSMFFKTNVVLFFLLSGISHKGYSDSPSGLSSISVGFYKTNIEFIRFTPQIDFFKKQSSYSFSLDSNFTSTIYLTPVVLNMKDGEYDIMINGIKFSGQPSTVPIKLDYGLNEIIIIVTGYVDNHDRINREYKIELTRKDYSKEYVSEPLSPGVWRIFDYGGKIGHESMYLIEGTNKAYLFDTGMGLGDLRSYLKTLTNLPIEVVITHGHFDHFGQVDKFKENTVYMSKADSASLKELVTSRFRWIKDGDILDLGNRQFEVIGLPGHTKGSLLFLDKKNRIIITGDAVGSGSMVYLFFGNNLLNDYYSGLTKVLSSIQSFSNLKILVGHNYQEKTELEGGAGIQYFKDMKDLTGLIINGRIIGEMAIGSFNKSFLQLAKAYYGLVGLWYNPSDESILDTSTNLKKE